MGHWINHVILWGGRNDIIVIGLGADGDSKVRKYYVETFFKSHGERNDVINIDNESFQFRLNRNGCGETNSHAYVSKRLFLSFAAYFISFRHNWHLPRIFSLYVCDLCFKHD